MTPAELTARGVRVKPLDWDEGRYGRVFAKTAGGQYSARDFEDGSGVRLDLNGMILGAHPTIEAAKAAAQADYEARILSAIEPVEAPPEVAALIAEAEARGRINGLIEAEKIAARIAGNDKAFNADRRRGAGEVQAAIRAAKGEPT